MADDFYYEENGDTIGPLDMLSMMKKIRNGKVTPETPIFIGRAEEAIAAWEIPELKDFFKEAHGESSTTPSNPVEEAPREIERINNLDLIAVLKQAWAFFSENIQTTFFCGGALFASVFVTFILMLILPGFIATFVATIVGTFFYYIFLMYMLRAVRMQEVNKDYLIDLFKTHWKSTLSAATLAGALTLGSFALMGAMLSSFFYLLMIPGLFAFSLFAFTPLILADNPDMHYGEAINQSKSWVLAQGMENIGTIAMLVMLNAICGLAFLPILITLPLTSIALVELYEKHIATT